MNPVDSPYRVSSDGQFSVGQAPSGPPDNAADKKTLQKQLSMCVKNISELQRRLYADDRYSLLLIFQAMDAAGKDSTIRAVMSGVNPAGCQVSSFKAPSDEELEHDWLWRSCRRLPERGRIGVFNRSYYEEVLAVRVHPEYLANQQLPDTQWSALAVESSSAADLWTERFISIRDHEKHLVRNGTVIVKFWLNVSKTEQKKRFLSRLTTPEKYWKFSAGDLHTRAHWDDYMQAYQDALRATSTDYAPWYAIPADDKRYMRLTVAQIVQQTMASLPLRYPQKTSEDISNFKQYIAQLENEQV